MIRRRRNFIVEIKLQNNQWIQARADIEKYFTDHFVKLFQLTTPVIPDEMENLFILTISTENDINIAGVLDYKEVKDVIWSMHPFKAPGPDGFPGLFFKHYWDIVGDQVVIAVQSFFREG